ncbi:MAG: hypothetical protein PCFJNLEI_01988 [Verrucomicrobiae bacterium]|nr:hypothetical protein [Verrucomicrobiae bacterium]
MLLMRLGYLWILVGLLMPCSLWAGETNLVLTIDGTTYSNVTWGATTPATVKLFHQSGVANVALSKLPAEWQKHFNYDPVQAEAYRTANAPPPEPPLKMLDRTETGKALNQATGRCCINYRCTNFVKTSSWEGDEIDRDFVDAVRWRLKQLFELQKTGHADYRAAIEKFIAAGKRAVDRHYVLKKGSPPKAPDRIAGHDLDKNIARRNIDTANAAIEAYNKELKRLQDDAVGYWAEGMKLKETADNKYRPTPAPPKPKPTPTNPYLEEVP